MIRTRDLILFVVALLVLLLAIGQSVLMSPSKEVSAPKQVTFVTELSTQEVFTSPKSLDRAANLARLRDKISSATELITPSPSVESVADTASGTNAAQRDGIQSIARCLYADDALAMVPRWPLKNVTISVAQGIRTVSNQMTQVVPRIASEQSSTTASSTLSQTETKIVYQTLLQVPAQPQKNVEVSCVPSEVVGVATNGLLIFNGDVNAYRSVPENVLIGYARDGFPIYGVYEGEVDACGGYDSPAGYRYTISTERDYIVGCYVGDVKRFSL